MRGNKETGAEACFPQTGRDLGAYAPFSVCAGNMDDPESSLRIPESCQILPDILQGTLIRESGSGVEVVFLLLLMPAFSFQKLMDEDMQMRGRNGRALHF